MILLRILENILHLLSWHVPKWCTSTNIKNVARWYWVGIILFLVWWQFNFLFIHLCHLEIIVVYKIISKFNNFILKCTSKNHFDNLFLLSTSSWSTWENEDNAWLYYILTLEVNYTLNLDSYEKVVSDYSSSKSYPLQCKSYYLW